MDVLNYIIDKYELTGKSPYTIKGFFRLELAMLFNDLGYKIGCEIGVRRGDYSMILCDSIKGVKMYGVDSWTPYRMNDEGHIPSRHASRKVQRTNYKRAVKNLENYNYTIIKKYSTEAAQEIPDSSLDFVYIDANHIFDFVMEDIIVWGRKVREGGIISGHDYIRAYKRHVMSAVDAYAYAHNVKHWFLTELKKRKDRSWFIVKNWKCPNAGL